MIMKLLLFLSYFCIINCSSYERISPGVNSNNELKILYINNIFSLKIKQKKENTINLHAYKINSKEDLNKIIFDQNNLYLEDENLEGFENISVSNYDCYLISFEIPEDTKTINISDIKIAKGLELPKLQSIYIYDYVSITQYKGGIAGSFEAISISNEKFPIQPDKAYRNKNKSIGYGFTDLKYVRTIRVLASFEKTIEKKLNASIQFNYFPNIDAAFSLELFLR
jgi:uncharacterized lipoprotein YehR (DUF1307 family)